MVHELIELYTCIPCLIMKIVIVGPPQAGKTLISNSLGSITRNDTEHFQTDSVRIVEYVPHDESVKQVELWDISGDCQSNWLPVIFRNAQGVIFVYNPDVPEHLNSIDKWFQTVVDEYQFTPDDCLVIGFGKQLDTSRVLHKPSRLAAVGGQDTRLPAFNIDNVRDIGSTIDKFIAEIAKNVQNKKQDDDEFD